jgi:hypothetical protein
MRTVLYRRWAPPASPCRIEFPPDLLHHIRTGSISPQDRGLLFGRRLGRDFYILAAARAPRQDDGRLQGLELLGTYALRPRGEVFLTDHDLEHLQAAGGSVALVIAGSRAGFFPREDDGSVQAVRSYEEFTLAEAAPQPEPRAAPAAVAWPRLWRHPALAPIAAWKWALAAILVLAAPVAVRRFLAEHARQPPVELSLREWNGQLVIRWDTTVVSERGARLEINDAGNRTVLHVSRETSGATYTLHSGDVEVRLDAERRSGIARWGSGKWGTLYNKNL